MNKIVKPYDILFEKVAGELAATWYEIGRGQGLTSKWPNTRSYVQANLEKFLPKAIEHCISMLDRSDLPKEMKEEIYDALIARANDPEAQTLEDLKKTANGEVDAKKLVDMTARPVDKLDQLLKPIPQKPLVIHSNPHKATRH